MKKYINSYDGIRVIALFGVVFYHLIPSVFKGGYLGVVTFFVMAGYLTISNSMEISRKENRSKLILGKIKDKFLKLYPPLLFMIFLVGIFIFFFFKSDLGSISRGIKNSILSIYNYTEIFAGKSYFENTGKLAPFNHLWALSLEFQVYILIFIFFYGNYKPSKKKLWFSSFLVLSILSYGLSAYLIFNGSDFTRVYYSTETRLYSFLIGGMAALISKDKKKVLSKSFSKISIPTLLCITIGSFFIFDIDKHVFYYIFPLYSLLIALLMIALRNSKESIARILSSPLFHFFAKRSYHIYLWHFPVIAILEKIMANTIISNGLFYLISLSISMIFSEVSYRINSKLKKVDFKQNRMVGATLILILFLFIVPYRAISNNSQGQKDLDKMKDTILENEKIQKEKSKEKTQEVINENQVETEEIENYRDTEEKDFPKSYYNALEAIEWVNDLDDSLYLDPDLYTKYRRVKGVLIGDSLASMSYHTLATYMPDFIFDSDHSRQMKGALDAYTPYADKDNNGKYIVLSLGTNGDVLHEDIDAIRDTYKDKIIILSTIILPYKTQEEERNDSIRSYAELHDNVYLVDWYKAAKDKPELFFDDKIHTGERGARIMSQIIMNKIIEIETSK